MQRKDKKKSLPYKQQLCFRLNWEWKVSKLVGISTQTTNFLAASNFDSPDQLGTMVPLLISPFYSQLTFSSNAQLHIAGLSFPCVLQLLPPS